MTELQNPLWWAHFESRNGLTVAFSEFFDKLGKHTSTNSKTSVVNFLLQTSSNFHLGQKNFNALTECNELTAESSTNQSLHSSVRRGRKSKEL